MIVSGGILNSKNIDGRTDGLYAHRRSSAQLSKTLPGSVPLKKTFQPMVTKGVSSRLSGCQGYLTRPFTPEWRMFFCLVLIHKWIKTRSWKLGM